MTSAGDPAHPSHPSREPVPAHHHSRTRPLAQRNVLTRSARFGPNMTPMVDVTLVILIFFMAATTIAGQEWFLRTDLPEARDRSPQSSGYALPTPVLDAELFLRDGSVYVRGMGDTPRPLGDLIAQIKGMDPRDTRGLVLRIGAGDRVPYGSVVALHEAASARQIRVALR